MPCSRCHAVDSVVLKSWFQLGEVQRRAWLKTSSWRHSGTPSGTGEAWGLETKNTGRLLRDNASAAVLLTPGTCLSMRSMLWTAQKNANILSNLISLGSRADPLLMAYITAMLSHRQWIFSPCHPGPPQGHCHYKWHKLFGCNWDSCPWFWPCQMKPLFIACCTTAPGTGCIWDNGCPCVCWRDKVHPIPPRYEAVPPGDIYLLSHLPLGRRGDLVLLLMWRHQSGCEWKLSPVLRL